MADSSLHRSRQKRGESPEFEAPPPLRRHGSDHIDLEENQFVDTPVSPAPESEINPVAPVSEDGETYLASPSLEIHSASGGESPPPTIEVISEGPLPSFNPPLTRASDPIVLRVGDPSPSSDTLSFFDYVRMASFNGQSSSGGQPTVSSAPGTPMPVSATFSIGMPPDLTPPMTVPPPFMHPNVATLPNLFGVGVAGLNIPGLSVPLPTTAALLGASGPAHVHFGGSSMPATSIPPTQPNSSSAGPSGGGNSMPGPSSQPAYQNIPSSSNTTWNNPMAGGSYGPWGSNPYMPWGGNVPMGMGMPWANYMQGGGSFPGFPAYPRGPSQSQEGQFGTASTGNQNVYGGMTGGPQSSGAPPHGLPAQNKSPFLTTLNLPDLSRLTNDPILHLPHWPAIPTKLPLDIPKFDGRPGEDPSINVMTFHLWCSSNSLVDDAVKLHLFQCTLTGAAAKWYIELPRGQIFYFSTMAMAFLTHFQLPIRYETGMELLTSLRQSTSTHISDHIHKWRRRWWLIKAAIPGEFVADWFLKSLLPAIAKDVAMSGAITEEDLILRAQQLDLIYAQSGTLYELIPHASRPTFDLTKPLPGPHANGVIGSVQAAVDQVAGRMGQMTMNSSQPIQMVPAPSVSLPTSDVLVVSSVENKGNKQPGGKKNKKKRGGSNTNAAPNAESGKEKRKCKFPCRVCGRDHLTHQCPHMDDVHNFLASRGGTS